MLKYPLEIESGQDFVSITHEPYRTNQAISGQQKDVAPNASAPPEGEQILLYMPNSTPAVSNDNSWRQQNSVGPLGQIARGIGVGAAGGALALGTSGANLDNAVQGFKDQLDNILADNKGIDAAKQVGLGMIAGAANMGGAGALTQLQRGEVYNPNVELLYESPGLRGFSLDFMFIPKSATEASVINKIILELKTWSAPDDSSGTMFTVPHLWNVKYKSGKQNDKFMNKFKKAALTRIQVQHNPGTDMHATFSDGTPLVTALSLGFMEVDIITRQNHIKEGGQGF